MLRVPDLLRLRFSSARRALVISAFMGLSAMAVFQQGSAQPASTAAPGGSGVAAQDSPGGAFPWTEAQLLKPEELATVLREAKHEKPRLFHVGFRILFAQAHIPGSELYGPTSTAPGLQELKERVKGLPRKKEIVLYCGCCPWSHCPNLRPAFEALRSMGFSRLKVLYLPTDFGRDWVEKGYPVQKGE
jgi:hypothetical protein